MGADGGVTDLSKLRGDDPRDRPAIPAAASQYVNDVQPSVQNDGTLTLTFAYQGAGGTGEPVSVTMPVGLFLELATLAPKITRDAVTRMQAQADRLAGFLAGGAAKHAQAEAARRGGPPEAIH